MKPHPIFARIFNQFERLNSYRARAAYPELLIRVENLGANRLDLTLETPEGDILDRDCLTHDEAHLRMQHWLSTSDLLFRKPPIK